MVVFQIHVAGIASLKAVGQPPVRSYRYRPATLAIALQRVQPERGLVHILRDAGLIQRRED